MFSLWDYYVVLVHHLFKMNFEDLTTYEQLSQDTLALSAPQVKASCFSLIGWLLWAMPRHAEIMASLQMFDVGRPVVFCINGWCSCVEINAKITSAFSWNGSFIGSYRRGCLWFLGLFLQTWCEKGLQTLLLVGLQRSSLILLFNVRSAKVHLEKSLTCLWSASWMLCVPRAEQSCLMVLSARGGQLYSPFRCVVAL